MFCCPCFSKHGVEDPRAPLNKYRDSGSDLKSSDVEVSKLPVLTPVTPSVFSDNHSDRYAILIIIIIIIVISSLLLSSLQLS